MVHQMNIHDVTYANDIATANYPWDTTNSGSLRLPSMEGPKDNLPSGSWRSAVGEDRKAVLCGSLFSLQEKSMKNTISRSVSLMQALVERQLKHGQVKRA